MPTERRTLLKSLALGLSTYCLVAPARAAATADPMLEPGSTSLVGLMAKLSAARVGATSRPCR